MLGANYIIDFSTKRGSAIFKQGCKAFDNKALTDGFAMTPNQTVIFVEAFHRCATVMVWNQDKAQGKSPLSPTALDVQSTSLRATARSMKSLS
jgi:hypothetical protein